MNLERTVMDVEARGGAAALKDSCRAKVSYRTALALAYQSFGVVYGDLSTSPLYVYKSTFSGKLKLREHDNEILGVLSFIFWTFSLVPLCKYIFFVLTANDNGEGGTFALYSLLCRHANLNLLPNRQPLDAQLSTYKVSGPRETALSRAIKSFFEKHQIQRIGLLLVVMLGTCLVIGDGVLTPTIFVLSAVQGIKVKADLDDRYIVLIACVILVGLFALQHFGTRKVGFLFAPIVIAWLLCINSIGIYNIIRWNPTVFRAISPYYMFNFFRKTKVDGWESLGGIVLCITGAEAMFADLGHFSQLSIKIAFTGVVYPCLILAYMGDAAFLSKHKGDLQRIFYMSIPDVGPVRPANFARNRRRPRPEAAAAAAGGAAVAGNPPAGQAERALRQIEQNFTELTRTVPMIEIEDMPIPMQGFMVGLPRTWVRLFRRLGRAVRDYNRAHRP